jgi:putative PEP-CTERM system histidine kinase
MNPSHALQIGALAYSAATVAFAVLTLLVRPGDWRLASPGLRLWLAALASVIWAAISAFQGFRDAITDAGLGFIDVLQLCAWLWALASIGALQVLPSRWLRAVDVTVLLGVAAALLLLSASLSPRYYAAASYGLTITGLLMSLLGVLSIEQVYRNASPGTRQALRWLTTGMGGLFVVDLFVFAETMLTHNTDMEVWGVRGLLFACFALPIAVGVRRMDRSWANNLFLSRQVMFYTTSFVLVGGYLVLMSIGGFYLRSRGGEWGRPAQVFFLTAATLLLGFMMFSGTIRRRLRVWLTKSFYRNRYDYRAEWLRFIRTLSGQSAAQSIQETAIVSVAQIIGSERGALWVRSEPTKDFLPIAVWPDPQLLTLLPGLSPSDSLARFMANTGWVVDLQELKANPALYDDLRIDPALNVLDDDAIILPLLHREQMYGILALARPEGLGQLNFEDRDLLKTVGRHLAAHLSQDDNDRKLAESRQFEAYNRLTAFVMHDLKNLTAQLQLVVHNAERHKRNPEFVDDAIATISNSVERMSRLLTQLAQGTAAEHRRKVDLAELVQRIVGRVGNRQPAPLPVILPAPNIEADPERLGMVLEHVLRNAQDATSESGEVRIELDAQAGTAQIRVVDDGVGMEEAFIRERLFRPFDTTKGSKGMGIGAYQAREYMRSLGGDVAVTSAPGRGTCFTFIFPAASTSLQRMN